MSFSGMVSALGRLVCHSESVNGVASYGALHLAQFQVFRLRPLEMCIRSSPDLCRCVRQPPRLSNEIKYIGINLRGMSTSIPDVYRRSLAKRGKTRKVVFREGDS